MPLPAVSPPDRRGGEYYDLLEIQSQHAFTNARSAADRKAVVMIRNMRRELAIAFGIAIK